MYVIPRRTKVEQIGFEKEWEKVRKSQSRERLQKETELVRYR